MKYFFFAFSRKLRYANTESNIKAVAGKVPIEVENQKTVLEATEEVININPARNAVVRLPENFKAS